MFCGTFSETQPDSSGDLASVYHKQSVAFRGRCHTEVTRANVFRNTDTRWHDSLLLSVVKDKILAFLKACVN